MTLFGVLTLINVLPNLLSGCAFNKGAASGNTPMGLRDYIEIPAESVITNVPMPTDEKKKYNIVTEKNGVWISLDGLNRLLKG